MLVTLAPGDADRSGRLTDSGVARCRAAWRDDPMFLLGGPHAPAAPPPGYVSPPGPDPADWTPSEAAPPPPSDPILAARLASLVNRCPVREPARCGCSDRRAICFRSGLPRPVTHAECSDCRSRE